MLLLDGILIFSFMVGNLKNKIGKMVIIDQEYNQETDFRKFVAILKKFNGG